MKAKEYWRLYRLVCKTKDLGEKRHIMFEQNKAMKWLGYLFAAFWCAYLLFFGVVLGVLIAIIDAVVKAGLQLVI